MACRISSESHTVRDLFRKSDLQSDFEAPSFIFKCDQSPLCVQTIAPTFPHHSQNGIGSSLAGFANKEGRGIYW